VAPAAELSPSTSSSTADIGPDSEASSGADKPYLRSVMKLHKCHVDKDDVISTYHLVLTILPLQYGSRGNVS